jgi:putative transcriptional regulator
MISATKRHLQGLDEMHQKIFRDAAVLSLGVGLVCAISYELLEDIKLISFEPEISHVIILMTLTFLAGMVAGNRKNRLKVLRAERDWTQAQLAAELEVSRQTVNAIEKGKFDPSLPLAFKAARLLELSIEEIFQDEATT